jgi:two-component system, NtrC family, response regulator HydG
MATAPAPRTSGWPDLGDLTRQLLFTPAEGRIWVHGQRAVLLRARAFAALRRELIERLGFAATREALARIGYDEGTRDAALAREVRPDVRYFDAFAVGPQVHALTGFGWTEVVRLEADPGSGAFLGEFLVHDSAEAAAHLDSFGPASEPACWMQTGYASGFASAFAGRPILMRELECRAMGHTACRVVGRPLDEWKEAAPDTPYYHPEGSVNRYSGAVAGEVDVVGISAGFAATVHLLRKGAPSRATLLFIGETGVGKEVFARLAHRMSPVAGGPFVAVNCAALPEPLIEAELFGVVRGAYTGASASRPGRFERADGGTLFLDEVASLSAPAQAKLLRALQEREIERVGDTRTRAVDVRLMAASNVDLEQAVAGGTLREDLYFRLATFTVRVPPLRERRDDIPLLMEHFRRRFNAHHGRAVPGFTERAVRALLGYAFPGNIRELEHMVERACLLAEPGAPVDLPHLTLHTGAGQAATLALARSGSLTAQDGAAAPLAEPAARVLDALDGRDNDFGALERTLLELALARAGGNLAAAARALGLTRRQVQLRLARHGVAPQRPARLRRGNPRPRSRSTTP